MTSIIASRQHPFVKTVRALHASKGRREHNLFLIEGTNAVAAALEAKWPLQTLIVTPDAGSKAWAHRADEQQIAIQLIQSNLLSYLSEAQSAPEVLAVSAWPKPGKDWPDDGALLVLDGIGDPGNAGTLIRAADAAGAGAIVATQSTVDLWSPKVIRASAGSLFHFPLLFAAPPEPQSLVAALRQRDIPIITAQAHGGTDAFDFEWPKGCALVLGHETRGISDTFEQASEARVTLPIYGRAESLNVAMAGTLLLYAWRNCVSKEV